MILQKELKQLEDYIHSFEKIKLSVSSKSIGWHLDHSLKVINSVINALKKSNPKDYTWRFNLTRTFVYTLNYFPRGKGKAPKRVLPPETLEKEDIYEQIVHVKLNLESLRSLPKNSNFEHPYFGMLNLAQTFKFLRLHTNHHLKICKDILA